MSHQKPQQPMIDKDYTNNNDVTYTSYGSPIYDPSNDLDESREINDEETEYDDEGYPVAIDIPTLMAQKTPHEILVEDREQRKITLYVILGCLAVIASCIGLAMLIIRH